MKKITAIILTALMVCALFAGCGSNASSGLKTVEEGKLIMATNAAFPPYEFIEGNEIVGIDAEIARSPISEEDWANEWKQYFKPINVGNKILIRPVWIDDYDAGDRAVLNLEPGVAFGTGTHETTRLCLQALENYITSDTVMLDVGCGSGILSVAGMLLGAKSVIGVDIDKLAVQTARENADRNKIEEERYTLHHGNLTDKVSGKFDVIAANIVADAIIMLSKGVDEFMNDDSVYIVSGIIDIREPEVVAALDEYGFRIIARHEEAGWLCFECMKK